VVVLAFSVYFVNGQPLIYFDTANYLEQGARLIGMKAPATPATVADAAKPAERRAQADVPDDATVVGSRSIAYGLFVAVLVAIAGLPGVVVANLLAIWTATMIFARRLVPAGHSGTAPSAVAAFGLIAACLGSLPFYVAFVMPDIFAPILILLVSVLFVHWARMPLAERTVAILLALLSIVVHPSHLMTTVLLVPVAAFASPFAAGRRLPMVLALAALLVGAGLAERLVFRVAVESYLHKRVVYLPFLTARLIDDGPGLHYLERRCPDPSYPTCDLFAALSASDAPERFDAPNILFARKERGSFALLPEPQKAAISEHQIAFMTDVLKDDPSGVAAAIARNVAVQIGFFSVEMTIPTPDMIDTANRLTNRLPASVSDGRLISSQPTWIAGLNVVHGAVYLGSLIALGWLGVRGRLSRDDIALTLIVLVGIIANAVVCGAVSEPANRYGARVMFLLPMMAAMFWKSRPVAPSVTAPVRR
jgi:hypothetical protein